MHLVSSCSQLLHHVQKKTFSCQTAAASSFYIVRHLLRRFQCLLNFFIHYFSFRRAPQGIGPHFEEAPSLDISRYTGTVTQGAAFAGHLSAQGPANAAPSARLRGALLEAAAAGAIFGATSFRRVAPLARAVSAVTPPRPSASGICQPSPFCCCCCSNHAHTHAEGDFPEATFPRRERTMA